MEKHPGMDTLEERKHMKAWKDVKDNIITYRHIKSKGHNVNTKFNMKIISEHRTAMDRSPPKQ